MEAIKRSPRTNSTFQDVDGLMDTKTINKGVTVTNYNRNCRIEELTTRYNDSDLESKQKTVVWHRRTHDFKGDSREAKSQLSTRTRI